MDWFRLHTSILDSRKVDLLPAPLFKTWIKLLAVASRFDEKGGALPDNREDLAFILRIDPETLDTHLDELQRRNFLDVLPDTDETEDETPHETLYALHDWQQWQFQNGERPRAQSTSTQRVRRFREKMKRSHETHETPELPFHETHDETPGNAKRNGETFHETPSRAREGASARSETETDTETETEGKRNASTVSVSGLSLPKPNAGGTTKPRSEPFEEFKRWFTGPVEGDSWRIFGMTINTPERLAALMANGPLWMKHKRYADGYTSAVKFLRSEVWLEPPKQTGAGGTGGKGLQDWVNS